MSITNFGGNHEHCPLSQSLGFSVRRVLALSASALVLINLSACVSISAKEMEPFSAKPVSARMMSQVLLSWELRDDVSAYCAKEMKLDMEKAFFTPPQACAYWNKRTRECVVVTSPTTTHMVLGHEVRHCFEGHFHD